MKKSTLLIALACVAFVSFAEEMPDIEIKVRFIEISRYDTEHIVSEVLASDVERMQRLRDRGGHMDYTEGSTVHIMPFRSRMESSPAPKVIIKSGTHVTIKNTKEYWPPGIFEVCSVAITNDTSVTHELALVPKPLISQEVGTTWSVLPTWNPENETIDLANLTVTVVIDDPVWSNYPAIYPSYTLSTNLSVRSGATAFIDIGTHTEIVKREDKIPVLGNIPLLGRLFRSQYEAIREKALLIFVTAKLVEPTPSLHSNF